ncbi:MAG: adenylosuccinate synthase, partial [Pedobacter sp.]
WIDLPALKYAIMLNGVTELIMMKADVLDGFDTIYACTHYEHNGETIDYMPYDIISIQPKPVLKAIEGWKTDLTGITKKEQIPSQLADYIAFLEKELEVPIKYLSVGPDRMQTLMLK